MHLTRRQLIQSLSILAGSALLPGGVLAALNAAQQAGKKLVVGSSNKFCVIDLQKNATEFETTLPFYPHSFLQEPANPENIWAIQRHNYDLNKVPGHALIKAPYTSRIAQINLKEKKTTRLIEAEAGSVFRGHGFVLPGTHTLFISRYDVSTSKGYLTGYDTRTGKLVSDYNVTKAGIHECKLGANGTAFIASSGQKNIPLPNGKSDTERVTKGGIVHFDLKNGKELSFTPINEDEQSIGHFSILKDGSFLAIAQTEYEKPIPPLAYMGRPGDKFLTPLAYNEAVPSNNRPGELFSVMLHEQTNTGIITSLANSCVILVDLKKRELVKKLDFTAPWGITFNPQDKNFVVSGEMYMGKVDEQFDHLSMVTLSGGETSHFSSGHSLLIS